MQIISTVQAGVITNDQRIRLGELLPGVVAQHLDVEPSTDTVVWNEIPKTYGYTAGTPSRSSIVRVDVPESIDQPSREALMQHLCDVWVAVTACTINEIVVNAVNAAGDTSTTS